MSCGGEGGIRTPGRGFSPYNGLANRRLQPLGHLSAEFALVIVAYWPITRQRVCCAHVGRAKKSFPPPLNATSMDASLFGQSESFSLASFVSKIWGANTLPENCLGVARTQPTERCRPWKLLRTSRTRKGFS